MAANDNTAQPSDALKDPRFPARGRRRDPRRLERAHLILVCLDRSPLSEVCLPHALSLAKTLGSAITLAHVMQPPHEPARLHSTDALSWEIARQEARAYLERTRESVERELGRPVDVRLEQGRPAERIVDLARELGTDLTVLGSHGEGGVSAWNLGSTAQQILCVARGSIFVAHASASAALVPAKVAAPRKILVPLDGSLRTESALPTAARIAAATGAELLLVHIVDEPQANSVLRAGEDFDLARKLAAHLETGARRYLNRVRDQLIHQVPSVRALVQRHANSRQCLLDIAQKEEVELIVLSAHGSACDPARAFGGVAADLLARSTVPLLALQDLPVEELQRNGAGGEELAAPPRDRRAAEGR